MEGNSGGQQPGTQASSIQSTTPLEEPKPFSTVTSWALKPTPASSPSPPILGDLGWEGPRQRESLRPREVPQASPPPAPQRSSRAQVETCRRSSAPRGRGPAPPRRSCGSRSSTLRRLALHRGQQRRRLHRPARDYSRKGRDSIGPAAKPPSLPSLPGPVLPRHTPGRNLHCSLEGWDPPSSHPALHLAPSTPQEQKPRGFRAQRPPRSFLLSCRGAGNKDPAAPCCAQHAGLLTKDQRPGTKTGAIPGWWRERRCLHPVVRSNAGCHSMYRRGDLTGPPSAVLGGQGGKLEGSPLRMWGT